MQNGMTRGQTQSERWTALSSSSVYSFCCQRTLEKYFQVEPGGNFRLVQPGIQNDFEIKPQSDTVCLFKSIVRNSLQPLLLLLLLLLLLPLLLLKKKKKLKTVNFAEFWTMPFASRLKSSVLSSGMAHCQREEFFSHVTVCTCWFTMLLCLTGSGNILSL